MAVKRYYMATRIGLMIVLVPVALQEWDPPFHKSGPSNDIKLVSDMWHLLEKQTTKMFPLKIIKNVCSTLKMYKENLKHCMHIILLLLLLPWNKEVSNM